MATAEIKAVITADDRASNVIEGFGSKIGSIGRTAAIGIGIAGAAVTAFGVASVMAFSDSEDKLTQLNAVLKSTGGVAGWTADQAIDLSKSLQMVTKYSDEDVLSVENLLLTFTSIGKDIMPQATETVLNMATALGEDTKSASIQLGKALQDPILGVTALRRVGVNFSDDQKKVIENLVNTGQKAQAQALILKELETEFGNSARAAGTTFAGQLARLSNAFNDLMEIVGGAVVEAITPFVDGLTDFVQNHQTEILDFFNQLSKAIQLTFNGLYWIHQNIILPVFNYFKDRAPAILSAFQQAWQAIQPALEQLWLLIKTNLWPAIQELWKALEPYAPYILGALVVGIIAFIAALAILVISLTMVIKVVTALANAFTWVKDRFAEFGYAAGTVIARVIVFFAMLYAHNKSVVDGIINNLLGMVGTLRAIGGAILSAILWPWTTAFSIIISGINAIKSAMSSASGGNFGAIFGGARASGGPVTSNKAYLVGEQGPEIFVPSSSGSIIPNQSIGSSSTNTTININVGLMTGSAIERREAAAKMFEDLKDIASQRGQTVSQLIGAN